MPYKDEEKRREYQREYMREWYKKNKTKHIGYVRNRDRKIKDWLKEYKQTLKCEYCEENNPACLEFHHTNPKDKKFSIVRINDYMSWKDLKSEIEKCRVLCANCHRKEHYDQREKE
jgi:hypothetical protein